jgi:hypothetical protein
LSDREEKLARLKKIANSGSVDSDTKVGFVQNLSLFITDVETQPVANKLERLSLASLSSPV